MTLTVAIPECGCHPKPLNPRGSAAKKSRKTNGFISAPTSDGLTRRVTGPWDPPRVRCTIGRGATRAAAGASGVGSEYERLMFAGSFLGGFGRSFFGRKPELLQQSNEGRALRRRKGVGGEVHGCLVDAEHVDDERFSFRG